MKARNAAVAALLAELRDELLGVPLESTAAQHVRLMRFEEQLLAPARRPVRHGPVRARARVRTRVRSAVVARPRRATALVASICVLFGSIGLSTAGALPGAIRHLTDHITDSIVHTFGVPQASKPHGSAHGLDARPANLIAPVATPGFDPRVSTAPVPSIDANAKAPASTGDAPVPAPRATKRPRVPAPVETPTGTPSVPTPKPPSHDMQKDPGTPTGFPSDWRPSAITAARAQMQTCALADTLVPIGCPQRGEAADAATPTDSVQWTVLNQPLAGAVAVVDTTAPGIDPKTAAGARVTVYGLFQMEAAYTAGGDATHTLHAYSGGIAEATMTWNGSGFDTVGFATGPVAQLPAGVHLPAFARPSGATDNAALAAVQDAFAAGNLAGDPLPGAVVSFDSARGDFTVTGPYAMASTDDTTSAPVTGQYTATLSFDGDAFQLIAISGSPA